MLYLASVCMILVFICVSFFTTKIVDHVEFLGKSHTMIVRGIMAITIILSHIAAQTNSLSIVPYGGLVSRVIGGGWRIRSCGLLFFVGIWESPLRNESGE